MRAALVLALALAAVPAIAAGKRAASADTGPVRQIAPQSQPLSTGECHRLGGTVNNGVSRCTFTSQSCSIVKPNGEVFVSCINEP